MKHFYLLTIYLLVIPFLYICIRSLFVIGYSMEYQRGLKEGDRQGFDRGFDAGLKYAGEEAERRREQAKLAKNFDEALEIVEEDYGILSDKLIG